MKRYTEKIGKKTKALGRTIGKKYYRYVQGFLFKKDADDWAERLRKKGYGTIVKKGKTIHLKGKTGKSIVIHRVYSTHRKIRG